MTKDSPIYSHRHRQTIDAKGRRTFSTAIHEPKIMIDLAPQIDRDTSKVSETLWNQSESFKLLCKITKGSWSLHLPVDIRTFPYSCGIWTYQPNNTFGGLWMSSTSVASTLSYTACRGPPRSGHAHIPIPLLLLMLLLELGRDRLNYKWK